MNLSDLKCDLYQGIDLVKLSDLKCALYQGIDLVNLSDLCALYQGIDLLNLAEKTMRSGAYSTQVPVVREKVR